MGGREDNAKKKNRGNFLELIEDVILQIQRLQQLPNTKSSHSIPGHCLFGNMVHILNTLIFTAR